MAVSEQQRSLIGDVGYYGPLTLFLVVLGILVKDKQYWLLPAVLLWQVVNYHFNIVLKNIFQQARPSGPLPTPAMGYFEKHKYYGFPSGHAQIVVSLGVFLLLFKAKQAYPGWYWVLAMLLVAQMLITGWQRVAYSRHTVLQVMVGSAIGAVIGVGFFYMLKYINAL